MKVVILCGGMGTRLREETESIPKPMVEIGNRPILWHIMKLYSHFGYKEFVLCLGYKGEKIKEYFYHYSLLNHDVTIHLGKGQRIETHGTGNDEDWRITLADTGRQTLKGARLKKIEPYIDGDVFLATYGDGLANIDISGLVAFHEQHGKMATLTGVHPPSLFGELEIKGNQVRVFSEKPQTTTGLINGGFFVFNRNIFDRLTLDEDCDLEKGLLDRLATEGELMVYRHDGDWDCMDTYRDMQYLNRLWQENRAFWKLWT